MTNEFATMFGAGICMGDEIASDTPQTVVPLARGSRLCVCVSVCVVHSCVQQYMTGARARGAHTHTRTNRINRDHQAS